MAVAFHGLNQARVTANDRVLVVGAGAIGLAVAAALKSRGIACDIVTRYPAQRTVAEALGANPEPEEGYDVAIDAVGSTSSVADCVKRVKPRGRISMVGCFWDPTEVPMTFCTKEQEMIASYTYKCRRPGRTFEEASSALAADRSIADTLITHRYPLEAAEEAFGTGRGSGQWRHQGGVRRQQGVIGRVVIEAPSRPRGEFMTLQHSARPPTISRAKGSRMRWARNSCLMPNPSVRSRIVSRRVVDR